ncbi:MAG TPA: peptide chain release factor N(5)-glutamine methyltransferase [Solirubrobacteraceae bacterium]|nr:peptide chain release factor N(5)-glutamine methyltransferase [Solirubrobacteraceae bacterium]
MAFRDVSVRDALDSARIPLTAAGCETPALDAELLLAAALGVDRAALHTDPDAELSSGAVRPFREMVARRTQREPIAYILGRKGFRRIELSVDPRVLIPRPDTETLVEAALELPRGVRVVDIGTGSGAVALALKQERADLDVTASDSSADALAVARANAADLGLDVSFVQADLLDGLEGPWDAVLSNPPYVADGERSSLPPEIARHEPAEALFAGADGLTVIRRLVAEAARATRWLALEVGVGQADQVQTLLREAGFDDVGARRDLGGIERVVVGRRC